MADLLTRLGLRANTLALPVPNYGPHFLLVNFFLSYVLTTTRFGKLSLGIDNNISPRYDLDAKAEARVAAGKITQEQLDRLRRIQSSHENSMEHYSVFAAAVLSAIVSGLDAGMLNRYAVLYTLVRAAYCYVYRVNTTLKSSRVRSVLWWAGNIICIRLFWFAGKALNAKI